MKRALLTSLLLALTARSQAQGNQPDAFQPACPAAEYVYAGARLLVVAKPKLPQAGTVGASSTVQELGNAVVTVLVITDPANCPSTGAIVINYAAQPLTATPGSDYTHVSGTLSFPAGTPSGTTSSIQVAITPDSLDEPDETFNLVLTNPNPQANSFVLDPAVHTITISDNDAPPTVSISDASVTEVDGFSVNATFTVSLSAASGFTVTVDYCTGSFNPLGQCIAGAGTATPGIDYAHPTSGTLTFPAGTTNPISVNVACAEPH